MGLRFVLGRGGRGKSTYFLDEIKIDCDCIN